MTTHTVDATSPADPARAAASADAAAPVDVTASAASVDAVDSAASVDAAAGADSVASADADRVDAGAQLRRVRDEIERIDRGIVELIAERVALARQVGPLKQVLGMPILDPPREAAIVRRAAGLAREAGLSDEDVRYVFWHLVGLSRRVQLEEG
jgi:chorismate mutase